MKKETKKDRYDKFNKRLSELTKLTKTLCSDLENMKSNGDNLCLEAINGILGHTLGELYKEPPKRTGSCKGK